MGIIFKQLFDSVTSTYSYILGCPDSREALIIDSVLEQAPRDLKLIQELGLDLKIALNTHVHADHVTGDTALKRKLPTLRSGVAAISKARADIQLTEGDTVPFGKRHVKVISTPGHTSGCLSFVLDNDSAVFTGDALLIRGCGRTDFQQGDSGMLYDSIHKKLFGALPATCLVYPGHDYKGHITSTIAEEMALNPRLTKSKDEFSALMSALGLPKPHQIERAVPANMVDGDIPEAHALEI